MLPYDLCEQATLFECVDPMDEELCGQAVEHGSLREMVAIANTWCDVRLGSAKIVTAGAVEYRACEIERIHWDDFDNG